MRRLSQFFGEQGVDDLQRPGIAALELTLGLVQHLHSSRHFQADQGFADPVEDGRHDPDGRVIAGLPGRWGPSRRLRPSAGRRPGHIGNAV